MSLLDELRAVGLEIHISSSDDNEMKICCPFCVEMGTSPDYRFRCGINLQSGLGHCYNCGWSSKKGFLELIRIFGFSGDLANDIRGTNFTRQTRKRAEPVIMPEGYQLLHEVDLKDEEFGPALKLCFSRGITREQLKRHKIGATIADAKYGYRVIFPIWDQEGLLLGLIGRDWTGQQALKYKNSTGTKSTWNGKPYAYPKRLVIISEGIFKALAIERAIDNKFCSASVMGNAITDTQVVQIHGFQEALLFPDPDKAGMTGFLNVAANLRSQFKRVSMAWPWPKKQADELTRAEIREALKGAVLASTGLRNKIKLSMRDR
jgi:hypothetical protein